MRASIALALGGAVAALALVVVLSDREPRVVSTNNVPATQPIVRLPPGASACQPQERMPAGAASVRVVAAYGPRGARLRLRFRPERGGEVRGRPVTLAGTGAVALQAPDRRGALVGTLCVDNVGPRLVTLAGYPARARSAVSGGGRIAPGRIRVEYLSDRRSWWSWAPTVADRVAAGRGGPLRALALWLAIALVAAAWAVGCFAILRAASR